MLLKTTFRSYIGQVLLTCQGIITCFRALHIIFKVMQKIFFLVRQVPLLPSPIPIGTRISWGGWTPAALPRHLCLQWMPQTQQIFFHMRQKKDADITKINLRYHYTQNKAPAVRIMYLSLIFYYIQGFQILSFSDFL